MSANIASREEHGCGGGGGGGAQFNVVQLHDLSGPRSFVTHPSQREEEEEDKARSSSCIGRSRSPSRKTTSIMPRSRRCRNRRLPLRFRSSSMKSTVRVPPHPRRTPSGCDKPLPRAGSNDQSGACLPFVNPFLRENVCKIPMADNNSKCEQIVRTYSKR